MFHIKCARICARLTPCISVCICISLDLQKPDDVGQCWQMREVWRRHFNSRCFRSSVRGGERWGRARSQSERWENYFLFPRELFPLITGIISISSGHHRHLSPAPVCDPRKGRNYRSHPEGDHYQQMRTGGEGNKKSLRCNYFPVAARHIMVQFCHFAINYPPSPLQSRGVISRKYWLIQISNGTTYIFLFFCCWYLTPDNNLANSVLTMLMTTCEGACKSGRMLIDRKNLPWARL